MCKQKLRHFNAFFSNKKLPVRYCTGRKAYVSMKKVQCTLWIGYA